MKVNYELYKVFYYVARHLSFSQAAKKLFISQSAVSQSIKTLEEELKTSLFIRSTKKVSLTKEGQLLLEHIEPALNLIKNGERTIQEINSFQKGEIHIGANDTISKEFLLPYLKEFHKLYPQIHIQITNRTSSTCVDLLRQGSVDLIVSNLPNDNISDFMEVREVFEFSDTFIAGDKFKELKGKEIDMKKLTHYPMLMLEKKTTTRRFFDDLTKELGVEIVPEVELGSIDLLIEMARIGLGISFVPDYCLRADDKDIFKVDIKEELPKRKLAVVTNKNIPLSIASKKFIDLLAP